MTQLENESMTLSRKLTRKERKMGKKPQKVVNILGNQEDALKGFHLMAARVDKSNQTNADNCPGGRVERSTLGYCWWDCTGGSLIHCWWDCNGIASSTAGGTAVG